MTDLISNLFLKHLTSIKFANKEDKGEKKERTLTEKREGSSITRLTGLLEGGRRLPPSRKCQVPLTHERSIN